MICDTMVGSLFQHVDVDAVIVGADRVVANGDTANKVCLVTLYPEEKFSFGVGRIGCMEEA